MDPSSGYDWGVFVNDFMRALDSGQWESEESRVQLAVAAIGSAIVAAPTAQVEPSSNPKSAAGSRPSRTPS